MAEGRTDQLPARGEAWADLERRLWAARDGDVDHAHGIFHSLINWPDPGTPIHLVARQAAGLFVNDIMLGSRMQPSVQQIAEEVGAMAREILHAPDGAQLTLTSGGTESNFLAVKTARDWAREHRPEITRPAMVVPSTAHPSFNKAAGYLDLEVVRVPPGPDYRADVEAMERAITSQTIMLVGSAPAWSHGCIDPIPELAAGAQRHGLWCHVDACVGGFLIPFLRMLGHDLIDFDFHVDGVDSLSADLHKYGYALKGISTMTLRDAGNVKHQEFRFDDWPFGAHRTTTFCGTKSAGPVASAWAVMKYLGREGYLDLARRVVRTTGRMIDGIEAIDGLKMLVRSEAGVFVYTSDDLDVAAIGEGMSASGYPTRWLKAPKAIHLVMDPLEDDRLIDGYLAALRGVVARVRSGDLVATTQHSAYA